ncbi:MAG: hypothetical protein WA979_00395 [Pacificimonas sp.]
MFDFQTILVIASSALLGAALVTGLAAWCWRGWLDLKRAQLGAGRLDETELLPNPINRIEVADLKERVRKLEAIAAGVEY